MRDHIGNINGALAVAFIGTTFAGWTVQDWAAFAALVHSCLFIARFCYHGVKKWRSKQ